MKIVFVYDLQFKEKLENRMKYFILGALIFTSLATYAGPKKLVIDTYECSGGPDSRLSEFDQNVETYLVGTLELEFSIEFKNGSAFGKLTTVCSEEVEEYVFRPQAVSLDSDDYARKIADYAGKEMMVSYQDLDIMPYSLTQDDDCLEQSQASFQHLYSIKGEPKNGILHPTVAAYSRVFCEEGSVLYFKMKEVI